jgi:hypothetical protein
MEVTLPVFSRWLRGAIEPCTSLAFFVGRRRSMPGRANRWCPVSGSKEPILGLRFKDKRQNYAASQKKGKERKVRTTEPITEISSANVCPGPVCNVSVVF